MAFLFNYAINHYNAMLIYCQLSDVWIQNFQDYEISSTSNMSQCGFAITLPQRKGKKNSSQWNSKMPD